MISHFKARLAATAVTLMIVLNPATSHAQDATATAPKIDAAETQMPYGKPANPATNEALAARVALKPDSRAAVAGWAAKADARVSAQAMYEDLRPDMASIAAPITLVYPWSAAGPTKPDADALYRKAYATAPHVTFVDNGDAAHFVMLDQPAAFQAAFDAFLQR